MGSGHKIPERTRVAIERKLREGKKGITAIAREHQLSPSAVKSIRIAAGLQPIPTPEAKERIKQAREHMVLAARERRARLMVDLLEDAEKLRTSLWKPAKVFAFGRRKDGEHGYVEHKVPEPTFKDKQAIVISMAVAIDKSLALERHDAQGSAAASAAIIDLVDRLGAMEAEPA